MNRVSIPSEPIGPLSQAWRECVEGHAMEPRLEGLVEVHDAGVQCLGVVEATEGLAGEPLQGAVARGVHAHLHRAIFGGLFD